MGDSSRRVRRKRKQNKLAMSYKKRRKNRSNLAEWKERKPDFNCAVAVWLHNFVIMTEEMTAQLNFRALELGSVSRCYLYRKGTLHKAAIFLFPDALTAADFRASTRSAPYKTTIVGDFLADVSTVESRFRPNTHGRIVPSTASIVFRNLLADGATVAMRISALFGKAVHSRRYEEARGGHDLRHIVVTYRTAAEAFEAHLAINGKWVGGGELQVELVRDGKVKFVMEELFKINKMIFQP